jgi:tRNA (uracil-5-)-methyltransferase TRM9
MKESTRQRLLELNQHFYATVAEPFDQTRRAWNPGTVELLDLLPQTGAMGGPLRVADIGCGNGRFALMLDSRGAPADYVGVDRSAELLERAARNTATLAQVRVRFVQADITRANWTDALGEWTPFDVVVCLATLHHVPSYDLRCQVVRDLARLVAPGGTVALTAWQFLDSERFTTKLLDWSTAGISSVDVEPGDALLPWREGVYAVRYVHQIDAAEVDRLAADAGLTVVRTYRADGKEGNLNLYALLRRN